MGKYTRTFIILMMTATILNMSHGYPLSSFEPVDRCIYTCIFCFKDNVGVVCANECLATDGKMHPFWFKTCPQLAIPQFFLKQLEMEENDLSSDAILDNKIH